MTPEQFEEQARRAFNGVAKKDQKVVMLKSWNEWAEGNYMEPDLKYGNAFILALKRAKEGA